jgi:hypothetical protein
MRAIIIGAALLALSSCTYGGKPEGKIEGGLRGMQIWTDPDTGCRYYLWKQHEVIYNKTFSGMSIRYKADGTVDCPKG